LRGWQKILDFQNVFYPGWRMNKPKLLFAAGLAGEVGEVCGVITHLEGGGTNGRGYSREQVLHQCVDSYVQLVLLVERYGFSMLDFEAELKRVVEGELLERLAKKRKE
jgi:hypothetical protein